MHGSNKILKIVYIVFLVIFFLSLSFSALLLYNYLKNDNGNALNALMFPYIPLTTILFIICSIIFVIRKFKKAVSYYKDSGNEIALKKFKTRFFVLVALLAVIILLFFLVFLHRGSRIACNLLMQVLPAAKEEEFYRPSCEIQSISNEGDRKVYILYYMGKQAQDCPAGCFYDSMAKIFDPLTFRIYDFNFFSRIFSNPSKKQIFPRYCGSTQNNKVSLYKSDEIFYWKYEFLPHDTAWKYGCELKGFYVFNSNGLYKNETSYKYYPVDCDDENQAKKFLEVSGVNTFGDVSKRCYIISVQIKGDCNLCNKIPENYQSECIDSCHAYLGIKEESKKDCNLCNKIPENYQSECFNDCNKYLGKDCDICGEIDDIKDSSSC